MKKSKIIYAIVFLLFITSCYFVYVEKNIVQVSFKGSSLIFISGHIADTFTNIPDGIIVMDKSTGKIKWVGEKNRIEILPENFYLESKGVIYPGFIDSHNHPSYNFLKRWRPDEVFQNRYEWSRKKDYKELMVGRKTFTRSGDLMLVAEKYAELKALISGTTMIQGCSLRSGLKTLVRNMDHYNRVVDDHITTSIFPLQPRELKRAPSIVHKIESGQSKYHLVHLGEGIDESSKEEFYTLKENGLIRPGLVIIHGTAFDKEEFDIMAENNIGLVWSPMSNYVLYGTGTKADIAKQCGLTISLAPDWSITGSDNMLDEFKFAWEVNLKQFNGFFTEKDLFDMMTWNPAKITGFEEYIGALKPGMEADIVIYSKKDSNPYKNLLHCNLTDVNLVMIKAEPFYGEIEYLERFGKKEDYEILAINKDIKKAIDITDPSLEENVPDSEMRLYEMMDTLIKAYPETLPLADGVGLYQNKKVLP